MDKHQLRQSAMTDFMQSLEQLNELWGSETENLGWDDGAQVAEADGNPPSSQTLPADVLKRSAIKHSEDDAQSS